MIKFFRKIRQRLLTEYKFSRYLLYAIGEVILVVIGILIALSINNWNQDRQTKTLEKILLNELKENLTRDLEVMTGNMDFHNEIITSSELIINVLDKKIPYSDTIDNHFSRILLVPLFFPTSSAYKRITSNGTHIISNDSLRFEIIDLYDNNYSWLKQWVDSERDKQNKDIRELYRVKFSKLRYFGKTNPVDVNKLLQDQEYKNYVYQQIEMTKYTITLYRSRIYMVNNILSMIRMELSADPETIKELVLVGKTTDEIIEIISGEINKKPVYNFTESEVNIYGYDLMR